MKKVRILHVFNRFDQGGIENFVINLLEEIDKEKFEFNFAIMSGEKGVLDDVALNLGANIYYFNKGDKTIKNISNNLNMIFDNYGPFDVIHSHCYFFSGYILYLSKKKDIPIRIAHSHETFKGQIYTLKRYLYEWGMRRLIEKNATYKLGCSKDACIHLYNKIDNKTFIINNAINIKKFHFDQEIRDSIRKELNLSNKFVIGHVGRMEDQKDHKYLIEIFNEIHEQDPNSILLLIGNGSLKNQILNQINELNLNDSIILLGNRKNVNELMQAMDVFVFPSKYEGLGIVLIEAQVSGLKCITSTNVPEEVNVSKKVIFLDKNDKNKWINTILNLRGSLRDNNEELIYNSGYSMKTNVKKIEKIYLEKI